MTILGVEGVGKGGDTLLDFLEQYHVQLLWHPSFSLESPKELASLIDRILAGAQELTLLCIEGSILHGPNGTGRYDTLHGQPKKDLIAALGNAAAYVLAMGTCARSVGYRQPRLIPPKPAACSSRTPSRAGCLGPSGAPELACQC
jgi:hydrogenase small subunit